MLAAGSGLAGVVLTALCAWWLDARKDRRRQAERSLGDVWAAIDGLRHEVGGNSEGIAELRGLLRGLLAEMLADPSLVDTPNAERIREQRRRRVRKEDADT